MANDSVRSISTNGSRNGSVVVVETPPKRIFCTLQEASIFLELPYNAIRKRHQRGTLIGVARAIGGSLWRPAGRSQVLIEAAAILDQLDGPRRERFEAWLDGRLSLAAIKREIRKEQRDSV